MRSGLALLASLGIASCDAIPQDSSGTTDQIESTGQLRVGIVSGTELTEESIAVLRRIARQHDAQLLHRSAPAVHLVRALDEGDLHLVIGDFGRASPLSKDVSLSPSIGVPEPRSGKEPVLRLARKPGENQLILLTDRLTMQ